MFSLNIKWLVPTPTLEVVSNLGVAGSVLVMIGTKTVAYFMGKSYDGVLFAGGHFMVQEGDEGCVISTKYTSIIFNDILSLIVVSKSGILLLSYV